MGFEYVEYNILAKYIRESITTEVRKHKLDDKDIPKALKTLSISHPDRAIQCKYLLAVLNCLDKSTESDKTCILNAAAFYIRDEIYESYHKNKLTPYFLSPENSTLYNTLTTSLNLTVDNFPNSKNLLDMYDNLSRFMHTYVYKDSDPDKGYLELSKQSFSSQKIKGYKVEDVLQDLVQKVANLKSKQIEQTREQQAKDSNTKGKQRLRLFSDAIPHSPLSETVLNHEVEQTPISVL